MNAPDRPPRPLADVLAEHRDRLLGLPGVTAVAEGRAGSGPCVVVLVAPGTARVRDALPDRIEGHPVIVREGGPFQAGTGDEGR